MIFVYITSISPNIPSGGKHRKETEAGRNLLGYSLKKSGLFPREMLPLPVDINAMIDYGRHGKPFFRDLDLHFSISHSHGLVACGLSVQPLGVDLEAVRKFSPELAEKILAPGEEALIPKGGERDSALTQLWTCKESCMKYTGMGLAQGAGTLCFSSLGRAPRGSGGGAWVLRSFPLLLGGRRFWLTVCPAGAEPLCVEVLPPV